MGKKQGEMRRKESREEESRGQERGTQERREEERGKGREREKREGVCKGAEDKLHLPILPKAASEYM